KSSLHGGWPASTFKQKTHRITTLYQTLSLGLSKFGTSLSPSSRSGCLRLTCPLLLQPSPQHVGHSFRITPSPNIHHTLPRHFHPHACESSPQFLLFL